MAAFGLLAANSDVDKAAKRFDEAVFFNPPYNPTLFASSFFAF
jgi:hypothetical protein